MPSGPAPAGARGPVGPFEMGGAAPMVAEKKVRLVIDDSAIKESDIGRKGSTRNTILVVVGLGLGLFAGFGIGSTGADRGQYNMAVRDGKDIYTRVNDVSKTLDEANGYLKAAVEASQGGPGRQAHVDYKAIESLRALKQPFNADEFSRRRYLAFSPAVVDALFGYYNNINLLWKKFEVIANKTTGDRAHEALDKSAQAADSLMAADYGLVVSKSGDAYGGGLVIVRPKPIDPNEKKDDKAAKGKKDKKDEDTAPIMMVSSRDGGREVERKLYNGQTDFADKSGDYVLLVDKAHSMGTLGQSANLFGALRGDLVEAQALMGKTMELKGQLVQELGKIATLPERKFF